MVSSHWTGGSYDTPWAGNTILPAIETEIPAGGIVKRFLLRNCFVNGKHGGDGDDQVNPCAFGASVDIIAGQYSGKNVYATGRRLPMNVVVYNTTLDAQQVFTQYVCAGDNEIGFNQRCSYGTNDGPGMTWKLSSGISIPPGSLAFPSGHIVVQFRILYVLA